MYGARISWIIRAHISFAPKWLHERCSLQTPAEIPLSCCCSSCCRWSVEGQNAIAHNINANLIEAIRTRKRWNGRRGYRSWCRSKYYVTKEKRTNWMKKRRDKHIRMEWQRKLSQIYSDAIYPRELLSSLYDSLKKKNPKKHGCLSILGKINNSIGAKQKRGALAATIATVRFCILIWHVWHFFGIVHSFSLQYHTYTNTQRRFLCYSSNSFLLNKAYSLDERFIKTFKLMIGKWKPCVERTKVRCMVNNWKLVRIRMHEHVRVATKDQMLSVVSRHSSSNAFAASSTFCITSNENNIYFHDVS